MTDHFYQIALTLAPGVGDVLVRQLVSYCGSAADVFRSSPAKLLKIPGIGQVTARAILHSSVQTDAERVVRRLEQLGASTLFYTDPAYPSRISVRD